MWEKIKYFWLCLLHIKLDQCFSTFFDSRHPSLVENHWTRYFVLKCNRKIEVNQLQEPWKCDQIFCEWKKLVFYLLNLIYTFSNNILLCLELFSSAFVHRVLLIVLTQKNHLNLSSDRFDWERKWKKKLLRKNVIEEICVKRNRR